MKQSGRIASMGNAHEWLKRKQMDSHSAEWGRMFFVELVFNRYLLDVLQWHMMTSHIILAECLRSKTSMENSSPLYQTYRPTVVQRHKPKIEPPHRRHVVHPRPQTPPGESVAKSETLLLIIPSLICQYDINGVHGNKSNRFLERKSKDRNILGRRTNVETVRWM